MRYPNPCDVLVVGGGHAGTEAALAAARSGARTLLLTHNIDTLGQMSCNPAIGGIGKGHLVREIDALGGAMARAADLAAIHLRTLNASKGPAVRATRAQADRQRYRVAIRAMLETQPKLQILQQAVDDLLLDGERVTGVRTALGVTIEATTVVLTVGTFLAGRVHVGDARQAAGRAGDPPATTLAERLRALPFDTGRLKTGTPPRIDVRSIDLASLEIQPGDVPRPVFSIRSTADDHPRQVPCHIAATNARTHEIIESALDRSPLFSGEIEGTGPRYCPSIEDKVVRFAGKPSHQIFVEPEGLDSHEVYPNGISTSLPFDVQIALVQSMAGFERAHLTRPGYAIEYDYFDPRGLRPSLETRAITNLYFAGQINGTTGYEEAAAQGLVAGVNAARRTRDQSAWEPRRDEAYIGVLIDDLVTRGTREPYRMFTSRAEHRLLLREDNADLRLGDIGRRLGLLDEATWERMARRRDAIDRLERALPTLKAAPDGALATALQRRYGVSLARLRNGAELVRMPEIPLAGLLHTIADVRDAAEPVVARPTERSSDGASGPNAESTAPTAMRPAPLESAGELIAEDWAPDVIEQVETRLRYAGYLDRQRRDIERQHHREHARLPDDLDYDALRGLSTEARQILARHRPATIGQAGRLAGVTPATVSLLLVEMKRREMRQSA